MFSICLGDKLHITNEGEDGTDIIEINKDDSQTKTFNFSPISEEWQKQICKKFRIAYVDTFSTLKENRPKE